MSITDIKDVKKLQKRLKSALDELKYIKKCCENAGRELEKNSFKWDGKEKNLVIQALELNEKYSRSQTRIMELKEENSYKTAECKKYEQILGEIFLIVDELEQQYDPIGNIEYKEIKDLINEARGGGSNGTMQR